MRDVRWAMLTLDSPPYTFHYTYSAHHLGYVSSIVHAITISIKKAMLNIQSGKRRHMQGSIYYYDGMFPPCKCVYKPKNCSKQNSVLLLLRMLIYGKA